MSPHARFAHAIERLNALTNRTSNRGREVRREEMRGDADAVAARINPLAERLEAVCDELEKALA